MYVILQLGPYHCTPSLSQNVNLSHLWHTCLQVLHVSSHLQVSSTPTPLPPVPSGTWGRGGGRLSSDPAPCALGQWDQMEREWWKSAMPWFLMDHSGCQKVTASAVLYPLQPSSGYQAIPHLPPPLVWCPRPPNICHLTPHPPRCGTILSISPPGGRGV